MLYTQYITKIEAQIKNISPLRIGDGDEGIILDSHMGKPMLPASGIVGAFRSYLEKSGEDQGQINKLFGIKENGEKSHIFVSDAVTETEYDGALEVRDRIRINPATRTVDGRQKFETKLLKSGYKFKVEFTVESENADEKEAFLRLLYQSLEALAKQEIRFGAQKTNGGGAFVVIRVHEWEYDLLKIQDLQAYLNERIRNEKNKTEAMRKIQLKSSMIQICAKVQCEGPLMIGGGSYETAGTAEERFIENRSGKKFIPGSTLKGLLRAQCSKIAELKKLDAELMKNMFGEGGSSGRQGSVFLADSMIDETSKGTVYHGIRMNKFTGGTWMGGKYASHPVKCKFTIKINIQNLPDRQRNGAAGLVLFALRDLLQGRVSLGGNFGKGFGRLLGDSIEITEQTTEKIYLNNSEGKIKIDKYLKDLESFAGGSKNEESNETV